MKKNNIIIDKNTLVVFKNLYILSLKSFIYSPLNMFYGVFLIFFVLVMWLLFKGDNPFIFASAIGTLIARNGVHTFYRNISMNRTVGFSIRMHFSGLHWFLRPFSNIIASLTINVIIVVLMLGLTLIFFQKQRAIFLNVNWAMFLTGAFLLWFLSVTMSYSIYVFCINQATGNILATLVYFLSYNLLGCAFPYETIADNVPWLNVVLYFLPQRYMMNVMQAGWVNAVNLNYQGTINGEYSVDFKLGENLLFPYLATFCFIFFFLFCLITFIIVVVRKQKKDGYGVNIALRLSSKYIKDIKKCSSIEELDNLRREHQSELGYDSKYIKVVDGSSLLKDIDNEKKVKE